MRDPRHEPRGSPTFADAARFWIKLGLISFGGPAGQIAIMHRELVERRRWVDEAQFTGALNFCMLLPGPEAMQLAIYIGWKLHGMRGGLVGRAGVHRPRDRAAARACPGSTQPTGRCPAVAGLLSGPQGRGRRAGAAGAAEDREDARFAGRCTWRSRSARFAALAVPARAVPADRAGRGGDRPGHRRANDAIGAARRGGCSRGRAAQGAVPWGCVLWVVPLLACGAALGFDSLWSRLYLFFTQAALVTFGGAYAVLGYVTQHLVSDLGWLTAEQSVTGLALAETTPGPLIIVLQFMGFMAGWNQPAPLTPDLAAVLAALLASWATFLPSFVFIFLGAPYVERITAEPRVARRLAAITAAVVGIIATLALLFARVVLLPNGIRGCARLGGDRDRRRRLAAADADPRRSALDPRCRRRRRLPPSADLPGLQPGEQGVDLRRKRLVRRYPRKALADELPVDQVTDDERGRRGKAVGHREPACPIAPPAADARRDGRCRTGRCRVRAVWRAPPRARRPAARCAAKTAWRYSQ